MDAAATRRAIQGATATCSWGRPFDKWTPGPGPPVCPGADDARANPYNPLLYCQKMVVPVVPGRQGRTASVLTVLVLMVMSVLVVPPASPTAWPGPDTVPLDEAPPCPARAHLEGLGRGCLGHDGLFTLYDDAGRLVARTHGPDHAHADEPVTTDTHLYPERDPACAEDPTLRHYVHIIEAHASDDPYEDQTARIQSLTGKANHAFHKAAQVDGRSRDIRVLCNDQGRPVITTLTLPTPRAGASFQTIVSDIRTSQHPDGPLDDPDVKYWVYYQDDQACRCAGIASIWSDDSASVTNDHNSADEPLFAVTFDRDSVRTWLHELAHTMGAVQDSAPNASGAGHCNDGLDILCYSDGGPTSDYDDTVCDDWDTFDCGQDDYFDPDPPPLSYLDTHWNLAHPRNRFVEGCQRADGRLQATVGGLVTVGGVLKTAAYVPIDPACHGQAYVLEGPTRLKVDGRRAEQGNDVDVCWMREGTVVSCDERIGLASEGIVPDGADEAVVTGKAGAYVSYSLRMG